MNTDVDQYAELRAAWHAANLVPLWDSPNAHKPPAGPLSGTLWKWSDLRPFMEQARHVTSPEAVERRVLQMINPAASAKGEEWTVKNIAAALQLLLPGEVARPHRHSMNALRFIMEGSGAVTVVDGKHCPMEFGDLVLTPGDCWHHHYHEGDGPSIWLDALDAPFHFKLGTASFQPGPPEDVDTVPDEAFGSPNILPVHAAVSGRPYSPVFRYPYADAVAALAAAPVNDSGLRQIRYVDPLTGGSSMPIVDSYMVQIDAGTLAQYRSTYDAVCVVVEGEGELDLSGEATPWQQRDIFTIPAGHSVRLKCASGAARIFMVTDRNLYERLGLI